ncbi:MAG: thioredoxin-disulfide reductase [Acidobacteria bacterium]|nr:thioredoxin-disulfide reductase [Acidobacteriota bacterium]
MKQYDVIIVGAGPAGLTAGLYCARAKLKTLILDKMSPGGQLLLTDAIEDYPGFDRISGMELTEKMENQARKFGAQIQLEEVQEVRIENGKKIVKTDAEVYETPVVIITSGSSPNKLEVPGERELVGKGVSYCALCDGAFFEGEDIAVVGGGDSALKEGIFLTKFARKLYLIHRRDQFRAQKNYQDKVRGHPKIELILDTVVERIEGDKTVQRLITRNVKTSQRRELPVTGVFIFIGSTPNTQFLSNHLERDPNGYLVTNAHMQTSEEAVYAAGDIRSQLTRQISNAVGDATVAAVAAEHYLESVASKDRRAP